MKDHTDPKWQEKYITGDLNTSIIRTVKGQDDHAAARRLEPAPVHAAQPRAGHEGRVPRLDDHRASIVISFLPAIFFCQAGREEHRRVLHVGARRAVVAGRHLDGGDTTFSTDTPNLVTNMVRERGVAENWLWWAFLLTGMMTVFFYARLWRRSGVLTDLEFYEIRYSGKAATFLRGFRAVYLGLFFNCVIMATVNLAAAKIANIVLGWPMGRTLAGLRRDDDLLRVGVGPLGRAGDRLDPVHASR